MLLVLELGVHEHSKYLEIVFRWNSLFLNSKVFRGSLVWFTGEVYDCCFLRFKGRTASSLSVESSVDDGFDVFSVVSCNGSCDPCREIIHESNRSLRTVDSSLYQIGVEK